ncbi:MAG: D-alanine--D-alanine ligase [Oscillospiraceae bacterium]|nr:D-alanine--D-alanine ligase [Oscillospiraceae bacterium]
MAKKKIAVLFGGASQDYAASLQSAYSVLCVLPKEKYDIIPIGITRAGRWLFFPGDYNEIPSGAWEQNSDCCSAIISPDPHHGGIIKVLEDGNFTHQRIDVIFPVLHGKYGECGRIQALCRLSGVPFVGSGFEAANACSDRMLTYLLLERAGIRIPKYFYLERAWLDDIDTLFPLIEEEIKYPMYVKASSCSHSIGANIATNREELHRSIKLAATHHHKVLVEQCLSGRELECAVTGGVYDLRASVPGEVKFSSRKEKSGFLERSADFVPAKLKKSLLTEIQETSKAAFVALGCKNFARFSFTLTEDGAYLRKAGAMPGFTEVSVFPALMKESGVSYAELLDEIIESVL